MRERIQKNKKETKKGDRQKEKDLDRVTQTDKRKSKHKKKNIYMLDGQDRSLSAVKRCRKMKFTRGPLSTCKEVV